MTTETELRHLLEMAAKAQGIDDAMRKDAERYQWLCKSSGIPKDGLDAAIAKAMGGGNG